MPVCDTGESLTKCVPSSHVLLADTKGKVVSELPSSEGADSNKVPSVSQGRTEVQTDESARQQRDDYKGCLQKNPAASH